MNLLNEARNARSRYTDLLAVSLANRDTYDRLCRESLQVPIGKYAKFQDSITRSYNAYIKARDAASEAEQTYNLAVAALLDSDD